MFRIDRRRALVLLPLLLFCSCNYGLKSAGGFPSSIRTIYIAPIDNKTVKSELDAQLFRELTGKLPRALGVRVGGEKTADAVLRLQITTYNDQAQNYTPGSSGTVTVLSHQVTVTVAVQIIDVRRNTYIWESSGTMGKGEYRPDTQSDEIARTKAIENLIQQIIDGAQSQW